MTHAALPEEVRQRDKLKSSTYMKPEVILCPMNFMP